MRGHNPYNDRFKCEQEDKMEVVEKEEEEGGSTAGVWGAALKVIPDIIPQ